MYIYIHIFSVKNKKPMPNESKDSGVDDDTSGANQNASNNKNGGCKSKTKYTLADKIEKDLPSELSQFLLRPKNNRGTFRNNDLYMIFKNI